MKRIAINGFGRIGRLTLRQLLKHPDLEVVAVNDLTDIPTLAHLFRYDSAHRKFDGTVVTTEKGLLVNGMEIQVFMLKEPGALPWKALDVDVVLECTGIHLTYDAADDHIAAGAKKVILSAPPKDASIPTYVMGVNTDELRAEHDIISNASCTTNCLANVIKIMNEAFGISFATMNTIHAFTQDQRLQDAPHKDLRRARAASMNIIPTSTGAAKAVEQAYPAIAGKLMASSYRVPIITGSIIELICKLEKETTKDAINALFKSLAEGRLKNILEYSEDPLVSTDIIGNPHSAIFDSQMTDYKNGYAKVVAWYDNEAGYAARLADLCSLFAHLN
ncbi:MAG TPA: type I glyceraldehyde-3-phosphate dehydrogenase [Saprospiraceae bacterium]|nr:type I glyceraldehyde-3-phosphate dehydrogenase [Saprospiraceae bacterium]